MIVPLGTSREQVATPREHSAGATAVTFLLARDDVFLLQQRTADAPRYPNAWCFPGGHIEPGESSLACVRREIEEEFGLVLPSSHCRYLLTYEHDGGERDEVFLCTVASVERLELREGRAMVWLPLTTIRELPLAFEQGRFLTQLEARLEKLRTVARSVSHRDVGDGQAVFRVDVLHLQGSAPHNEDAVLVRACAPANCTEGHGSGEDRKATDLSDGAVGGSSVRWVRGGLFGVFDGATSLAPASLTGEGPRESTRGVRDRSGTDDTIPMGGFRAARIVRDVFGYAFERGFVSPRTALDQVALEANRKLQAYMEQEGLDLSSKLTRWGTTASVVWIDQGLIEWVSIGDSRILLLRRDGSFEILGDVADHDVEALTLMRSGATAAVVREAERRAALRVNIDYGLLNGEPDAARHLRFGRLVHRAIGNDRGNESGLRMRTDPSNPPNGEDICAILLFTDGLLIPRSDPSAPPDWPELLRFYGIGGLGGVADAVRAREASDPDRRRYPRFKLHDDIAAIGLDLRR